MSFRHQPNGTAVAIDPGLCQRCGACTGVCPTSSLERSFDTDEFILDALSNALSDHLGEPVILTCGVTVDRIAMPPGTIAITLRSLLVVNETHVLHALRAGAGGVVLVGCRECHHDAPDLFFSPIELVRAVTLDDGCVGYIEDDGSTDASDRLDAYLAIRRGRFVMPPVGGSSHGTRRERFRHLLGSDLPGPTAEPVGTDRFASVLVDDVSCTMCGACSRACPTGAIAYGAKDGTLSFDHLDCVNCGLCVPACPEGAVNLVPGLSPKAASHARRPIIVDDVERCAKCGDPFIPARLAAHARSVIGKLDRPAPLSVSQVGLCDACKTIDWEPGSPPGVHSGTAVSLVSRRQFMKSVAAGAAGAAMVPLIVGPARAQTATIEKKRLGMVIDLGRCIGCHACTNICKAENNVPLGKFRDWVEEHILGDYPNARPVFLPKLCNHCDDPGCLRACPTGAIRKRPDGIVDLDPDICIACQACMQGCPYGSTFFNHQRGTADKCNLCVHRIDQGLDPACVDICPSQCRIVGDFDDPNSPVSQYLVGRNSTVLREDLGLGPNILYIGLPGELNR